MLKLKRFYLWFFLVLLPLYSFAESDSESIIESNIPEFSPPLTQQITEHYNKSWGASQKNLNEQEKLLLNPENPWENLQSLINEGLSGISESNEALSQLQKELQQLKVETLEQRLLYEASLNLLTLLKMKLEEAQNSVEIALDRMQDAEDYASWIDAQNELLKQEVKQYRRGVWIGWTIGAVSFGAGTPLIIEGIRADNKAMLWSGVGLVFVSNAIWMLGRCIFHK